MPTTLIFGGSGKVARYLARILVTHQPAHTVYSVIRNADQAASLEALGAKPVIQSIEASSVADLVETYTKLQPDFVVWAAGAGGGVPPERTVAVDRDGAIRAMDALALAPTPSKRFIMVSSIEVRDNENKPRPDWYTEDDVKVSKIVWDSLKVYLEAKLGADKSLREENGRRGLEYTILRPGRLTLEPATGKIRAGKTSIRGDISREDVAKVALAVIENPKTIGLAFDFLGDGAVKSIEEEVERVAEEKIDTFEGYY